MAPNISGILNIDKPAGWTSHDVVGRVRRVLGLRRVGHAGTLDPMATGVLLVCVGHATRLSEYLMAGRKTYRALMRFGLETNTYDTDGMIMATRPVPALTESHLEVLLARFIGTIQQQPPAFSAIKDGGVPAYRRARQGQAVELQAREVTIHAIRLLDWRPPDLTVEVTCEPGTYIRSLAHDLGQAAGCGATLAALVRLRSGRFAIEDAVGMDELERAAAAGRLSSYLHPMQAALAEFTLVAIDHELASQLALGRSIICATPPPVSTGYAISADGEVLAMLRYEPDRQQWQPFRVFHTMPEHSTG
jgi:tRNA pseudouridine55 synthase